jgi:type II secretory pathway pseudopilin PulG
MVVIVIIGILSALAIPKMFGVSAKAKAAEAPSVIANYETLQSAYAQETGAAAAGATIGWQNPGTSSMWFTYSEPAVGTLQAAVMVAFGACTAGLFWSSGPYNVTADAFDMRVRPTNATCAGYTPNFQ